MLFSGTWAHRFSLGSVAALAALLVLLLSPGCGGGASTTTVEQPGYATGTTTSSAATAPDSTATDVSDTATTTGDDSMTEGTTTVLIKTSMGEMTAELYGDEAPITVQNFLSYVSEGFYDGTIFHRVIPGFMIQGGGFTPDMQQKPTKSPIKNEAGNGLKNLRGTLAMARTAVVDSATSQFFINVADNAFLDHSSESPQGYGYAVFGKVISGLDVADAIVAVPRGAVGGMDDVPATPVVIESIAAQE